MTIEYIDIGSTPNDGSGDPLRVAFQKINNNFANLANGGGGNGGVPGGNTTEIQYNDNGSFAGSDQLTFDNVTNTLSATRLAGSGANITNITANNIVGVVRYANVSNVANYTVAATYANVANSVAGANVSGMVANAATAQNANRANVANIAISVAGANVVGAVAYATTANSVAVANVVGIGNIALINIDGNSSNVLYGDGVWASAGTAVNAMHANVADVANSVAGANVSGQVPFAAVANSVAGANVSGDVAGANHANVANIANLVVGPNVLGQVGNALIASTVYTNAQPNITSVGTLTTISTSGNANVGGNLNVTGTINGNLYGKFKVPFSYSGSGSFLITTVPSGAIVTSINVSITTFFDDISANITVGTASDHEQLLAAGDTRLQSIAYYGVFPNVKYSPPTQILLYVNPGSSTVGEGLLTVNFE